MNGYERTGTALTNARKEDVEDEKRRLGEWPVKPSRDATCLPHGSEWKQLAGALDRLCLTIQCITIIIATALFYPRPHYD